MDNLKGIPSPTEHWLPAAVSAVLVHTTLYTTTGLLTHSAMTDLQLSELGGSTQKTPWQLCQPVAEEPPGELSDQTNRCVKLCITQSCSQRPDWQVDGRKQYQNN